MFYIVSLKWQQLSLQTWNVEKEISFWDWPRNAFSCMRKILENTREALLSLELPCIRQPSALDPFKLGGFRKKGSSPPTDDSVQLLGKVKQYLVHRSKESLVFSFAHFFCQTVKI